MHGGTAARHAQRHASLTACHTLAPPAVRTGTHTHTLRLPASRCTDHRLGSNFALDGVLSGQIEPIVGACIAMDQQEQLEEMQTE